jgi:hypothetical protein
MNILLLFLMTLPSLHAFCGFYVARGDAQLFNQASQVVVTRHDNKTVISMLNDYKGELKDFAMVVPVPTVLKREQVHVSEKKIIDHLDAYSSPRLVEYFDENPCRPRYEVMKSVGAMNDGATGSQHSSNRSLGIKIEDQFTVGEYDIVILSAKESKGLETWLKQNQYKIPAGASQALEPYIKQELKFFVAKVNLKEQAKSGYSFLRPLQFAFESNKFMLPIRLGMINSQGPQDLIIYLLTKNGRVESTNYRTVKIPSNSDIPEYIKNDFGKFYQVVFDIVHSKENKKVIFMEYFWNMGWCDPCAADPLARDELQELGVFWLEDNQDAGTPKNARIGFPRPPINSSSPVMITRLHVRYDREHFPEDLMFQETQDQENFQGRYVMRHPWNPTSTSSSTPSSGQPSENSCPAAKEYFKQLPERFEREAQNMAQLTGWDINEIRKNMKLKPLPEPTHSPSAWWKKIWK